MIPFLCALSVAFAVTAAIPAEDRCVVGPWSTWSDWESTRRCTPSADLLTYRMNATGWAWDSGRAKMAHIMEMKQQRWAEKKACLERGDCPAAWAFRPSSGATSCVAGSAGDLPCSNVDQEYFINFSDMGVTGSTTEGNDVWGWTDPENGDEYAIMCLTSGTTFVRVTDPKNPVAVGVMNTATTSSVWRDAKVIGNYAYVVSEARGHGLQVFDLTRLRGRTSAAVLQPDAVYTLFGNAHNIVANEETNFLYVVGATSSGTGYQICAGGLHVVDVRNPLNPTFAGCFGGDGYVHDAQCVNYHGADTRYTGREICFCFNEDSFTIVDVTTKGNGMSMISKTGYVNVAYTHQGWVTDDHLAVLMDDEQDEYRKPSASQFTKTYWWDVTDLRAPSLKSIFESPERSIDHNQYIIKSNSGREFVYQANYEAGLRILSLNRASNTLTQVGYFDVYPGGTTAEFNGAWSTYPYFKSGTVLISSIDYGLFIVRPNYTAIEALAQSGNVPSRRYRTREVLYQANGAFCPALEQYETELTSPNPLC